VIKILCWLLTEMLEVRILPGEPFFTILRTRVELLQLEDF